MQKLSPLFTHFVDCPDVIESPEVPLYLSIESRYLSPSSATLNVEYSAYLVSPSKSVQVNSQHDVISGCQTVKIVISKPELAIKISTPILEGRPAKVKIN